VCWARPLNFLLFLRVLSFPFPAVRAVLAERGDNPALASSTATQLQQALDAGVNSPLPAIMTALARPTRIVRGKPVDPTCKVDAALFEHAEEHKLFDAYQATAHQLQQQQGSSHSVEQWLAAVQPLVAPIDAFFDKVFVMCEDEKVRNNRLALLRDVAGVTKGFVDLSQLPGF
jgi:glycyl-tRNA synthetase